MSVQIPPSVNYPSPLNAVPSFIGREPTEGRQSIGAEITWGSMGGANKNVFINFQNNQYNSFSQIVALQVDNAACGTDVVFIFPDTGETLTIPAYQPNIITPVFTDQKQFYVLGANGVTGDVTRFQILNYVPPPIATPAGTSPQFSDVASSIALANGTTALTAGTAAGTINGVQMSVGVETFGLPAVITFLIQDGTGKNIAASNVAAVTTFSGPLLSISGLDTRFSGGLSLIISGVPGGVSGNVSVNLYYRVP